MTRALRAWGPPLAWAAVIFWASSRGSTGVSLTHGLDKVAHFCVYTLLGALLRRAWVSPLGVVALGWAYAASDEIHQSFVPGRSVELADWFADALGVLVGLFIYHRSARRAAPVPSSPS